MYGHSVNINLTKKTKLNSFKELEDQNEPKYNKRTKMNQTSTLED